MATTDIQKQERAKRARAFLNLLISRYPACFTANAATMRPLAIGIQKTLRTDLAKDAALAETPGWVLRQALALYTRAPIYLEATLAGKPRVALDGSDAGEVTSEALEFARTRREEQKKRQAERRKLNAQAKRRKQTPAKPTAEELRTKKLEDLAAKFNKS